EKASQLSVYMSDPEVRKKGWKSRLAWTERKAEPNAGHLALVELQRRGKLRMLVTQNIDGLHLAAGTDPDLVVEIHGTMRDVVCMSCGERAPMERPLDRARAGD